MSYGRRGGEKGAGDEEKGAGDEERVGEEVKDQDK